MSKFTKVRQVITDHQFACFVILCILIATVMTLISLELYRRSGAMKLDMSRPGYEKVRTEVEKSSDDQPYDSSGTLTEEAVQDFDDRVKKYQGELEGLGQYDNSIISDENLDLVNPDSGNATDTTGTTSPPDAPTE